MASSPSSSMGSSAASDAAPAVLGSKPPTEGLPLPRPLQPLPHNDSALSRPSDSWMSFSTASVASLPSVASARTPESDAPRSSAARVRDVCLDDAYDRARRRALAARRDGSSPNLQLLRRAPPSPGSVAAGVVAGGSLVEIRLEARNLLNKDTLSLSDPFAVLYADNFGLGVHKIGQTETVFDDLNPNFVTRFLLRPRASPFSTMYIEVYDRDDPANNARLSRHDFLGRTELDVSRLLEEPGGRVDLQLKRAVRARRGRTDRGMVSVFAEVLTHPSVSIGVAGKPIPDSFENRAGVIVFRINCTALKKKGISCGNRSICQFYEIQRRRREDRGGTSWTVVYRSENGRRINEDGFIEFRQTLVDEIALHNGDPERDLRFVFYRRNVRSAHEMICYAETSVSELTCVDRVGSKKWKSVPLVAEYQDYEGMGSMRTLGMRRYTKRENVVLLDLMVDIFMPKGYSTSFNSHPSRRKVIGGGVSGRLQSLVSLY